MDKPNTPSSTDDLKKKLNGILQQQSIETDAAVKEFEQDLKKIESEITQQVANDIKTGVS